MWKQVVVIITCFSYYSVGQFASENVINLNNYEQLQFWIDQICINYTDPSGLITIISEESYSGFYDYFNDKFTRPKIVYDYKTEHHLIDYYKKPGIYIIFLVGVDLKQIMYFLHSLDTWHPQAKIIVCYQGLHDQKMTSLQSIVKILYEYFVFDVVIVTLDLEVYTYDPYKLANFNEPDLGMVQLGSLPNNMFFNKIPLVWRNSVAVVTPVSLRPYVISVQDKSGIDMDLMETLGKKMGLKLRYDLTAHHDWGRKQPDGSYSSVYGILQRGETDFVNGHFHLREVENLVDFDYTFSYTNDPLLWMVPCPVPVSNWSGLILIFAQDTWVGVLVTLGISLVFWQVIGRLIEKGGYFTTWYSLEVPFLLFLGLSISGEPRRFSTRLMYLSSWFFGFILTTSWLSNLTASLTHVKYEKPIRSLSEIIERGLVIGLHPELAEMYGASNDKLGLYIAQHYIPCDLSGNCWERISYQKDMASVTTLRIYRYITYDKYMNEKGERLMQVVKDLNIDLDHTLLFFFKGHPMFARTSQLLMWIFEAGFINYFDDHVNFKQVITYRREIFDPNQLQTKKLKIDAMLAPFALLFVGLLIGSVVFVFELVKYYYLSPRKL